jgi:hypothetical protein
MKLSILLSQRRARLRQARLSNCAFAYWTLHDFARRVARAGLRGQVRLAPAVPDAGLYCPTLTALDGSQSVLEEHFTDEDIIDLLDAIAVAPGETAPGATFRIERIPETFLAPLRLELERAGVLIDQIPHPAAGPLHRDGT